MLTVDFFYKSLLLVLLATLEAIARSGLKAIAFKSGQKS
jgi:hypothetical protein